MTYQISLMLKKMKGVWMMSNPMICLILLLLKKINEEWSVDDE